MQKPQIKMRITNWWFEDTEENFYNDYFVRLLSKKYDIIYSQKPDFLLYGPFEDAKTNYLDYECVRISYFAENVRGDYNVADYTISGDYINFGDRHLRYAFFVLYGGVIENRPLNPREKFCAYIVSNGGWGGFHLLREDFFDKLNTYKKVDSGGRHRNNIGGAVADKHAWLQNYKFNLCFENSSFPGYLTEKLFDAYNAGCVPIYWGDTSLRIGLANENGGGDFNPSDLEAIDMRIPAIDEQLLDYKINPKAFINAHNFPNLNALLDEVKRIDNDDAAFEAMRREPLFLDNFNPREFYEKKLLEFFDNIFSQGANLAFRRGVGQHLDFYRNKLKPKPEPKSELSSLNLTRDAINIAKFISKTQQNIKKLRFWRK